MSDNEPANITVILQDWSRGNQRAADTLIALVYDELRKVAANYLRRERSEHTLQPTALVNEAYLKLIDISNVSWRDRAHFFAVASNVMRQILVDHARARATEKRGGNAQTIALDEAISFSQQPEIDLLALDDALKILASLDEKQAQIVEMRFFGGLSVEETAEVLGVSARTVKREWAFAKAWLHKTLKSG
jgi:RNA polymerase sigma-70 factor, ECF subfamily